MPSYWSKRSVGPRRLFLLTTSVSLLLGACAPTKNIIPPLPQANQGRSPDSPPVRPESVTLTVGTKRWTTSPTTLEEAFLPVAVTLRNNHNRPLCGGVQTATLQVGDGSSISAVVPTNVVERLFGPIAAVEPELRQQPVRTLTQARTPLLKLVQGVYGGSSFGYGGYESGVPSGGLSPFAPSPFSSPYSSPFSSPYSSPYSSPFSSPYSSPSYAPYSSPFSSLFPFPYPPPSSMPFSPPYYSSSRSPYSSLYSSPYSSSWSTPYSSPLYSPFYPYSSNPLSPFSRYSPYDYGYALPPLPFPAPPAKPEQPKIDQSLLREIFTAAFASRPLEPQEARTGFLFFPRPASGKHTLTLNWSWYDCVTHELVTNLSASVTSR